MWHEQNSPRSLAVHMLDTINLGQNEANEPKKNRLFFLATFNSFAITIYTAMLNEVEMK